MESIVLVGYGGHAKSVADSIQQAGKYHIVGYTDYMRYEEEHGYKYLGTDEVLEELYSEGVKNAVISVGYMGKGKLRERLYKMLKEIGFHLPVIMDSSAIIARDVVVDEGVYVGKGAIINAGARIHKMCIINSKALIEHECEVRDFSHIAVGAILCGNVKIGEHAFVGANATIIQGVTLGNNTVVGAASTVLCDVGSNKTIYGICSKSKHPI